MKYKVLFIGGGRRVSLARRFREHDFDVFSYELEENSPIKSCATVIKGLRWADSNIVEHIKNTVKENNIDLVIPLQDIACTIVSETYSILDKTPTSSYETNQRCFNKYLFELYYKQTGFLKPKALYPFPESNYSIIKKPATGFNSRGLIFCPYDSNLKSNYDYVVQKDIKNRTEISVDAYFNQISDLIGAVPRKRIEIQGGEVCRSITLNENYYNIYNITKALGKDIGLIGPTCIQYIVDNDTQELYVMEVNARFGGGVILSLEAGFDIIDLLKREYILGEDINEEIHDWKVGQGMTRYFSEYFYE